MLAKRIRDKTRFTFLSSNSSFIECVRKHKLPLHLRSNSNDNDDSCRSKCTFDHYHLDLSTTTLNINYEFDSSKWVSCTADYGGGIYLKAGNTVSLFVTKGEFYSCVVSHRGGGIYADRIGKVEVTMTLFHACIAEAQLDYGGGGIGIDSATALPSIESSSFISCISGNDAGGVALWYSPFFQRTCFANSRFVGCQGLSTTGSDGGSIIIWWSNAAIGFSNTLFVDCHSEFHGGALSYYIR